jgi:hypothetical protein
MHLHEMPETLNQDLVKEEKLNEDLVNHNTGTNRIKVIVLLLLLVQNVTVVLAMKKASKARADDQKQALTPVMVLMVCIPSEPCYLHYARRLSDSTGA